jgi:hypothetical protein
MYFSHFEDRLPAESFSEQDYSAQGKEIWIINRAIADCQIIGYDRLVGIDLFNSQNRNNLFILGQRLTESV